MPDNPHETDSLATLLRTAGRRPEPPREDYERVLSASREAWVRARRQRARRRWSYSLAAGFALIAILLGVMWRLDPSPTNLVAGRLTHVAGGVFAGDTSGDQWAWITLRDQAITAGTRLRSDPSGRAALRLDGNVSLRIAGSTDLVLQPANRIELLIGRVYFDTHGQYGSVEVVTRFGTLRDVGTQFEVLASGSGLRVRTREGAVQLSRAGSAEMLECGLSEELRIDATGRVERGTISTYDAEWDWAQALAEPPRGDALPLITFLDWVARETGRQLKYDSAETEARVSKVILHGTTTGLSPVQALEAALATTDIQYSLLDDGSILLQRRQRQ